MIDIGSTYEIKENPDRRISFGFTFDRFSMGGNYEYLSFKIPEAGTSIQNDFKADLRVPVASFLTLSVGGGYSTQSLGLAFLNKDERWKMEGYNMSVGFRVFFPAEDNETARTTPSRSRDASLGEKTAFGAYAIEMEKLNMEREKSKLSPRPIMTFTEWSGKKASDTEAQFKDASRMIHSLPR